MGVRFFAVPIVCALLAVGCATDPYLTCGAKCADGAAPPADGSIAPDGTTFESGAGDSSPTDSPMCTQNGNDCGSAMECCSMHCSSYQRCVTSCQMIAQSCTSQPDTCCMGTRCSNGTCVMCASLGDSCSASTDCCSGKCSSGDSGPRVCIKDN